MKLVVRYPNGRSLVKYVTDKIAEKIEETPGRTRNFLGTSRVYIRQGKPVIRKPGVIRRSARVIEVNKVLESVRGSTEHPAVQCAGLPWRKFLRCMSENLSTLMSQKYSKEPEVESGIEMWLKGNYAVERPEAMATSGLRFK